VPSRDKAKMKSERPALMETATRLVTCTPNAGISTKLPSREPATAPNVLTA
jgi:hypothetical protein